MILRLVWRSLVRRPGRSALLLAGYALGVGVTVALLSIGSALLEQARDRELVGGGDLAVLPAGIDLETLKTGGVSSLYFTVEQAPFLYRQVLAGPRFRGRIGAAAPWIDDELLYLDVDGRTRAVSAGGRIPSLSRRLGVRPDLVAGRWEDAAADRRWRAPGDSVLYAEMDHFHLPAGGARGDSTWAEWHYFNVRLPGDGWIRAGEGAGDGPRTGADARASGNPEPRGRTEAEEPGTAGRSGGGWLYLTYMVTGAVPDGRWGGRMLATLVTPAAGGGAAEGRGGLQRGRAARGHETPASTRSDTMRVRVFERRVPGGEVAFSLIRPDLRIGGASVTLDSAGAYRLRARVPRRAAGRGRSAVDGPEGPGSTMRGATRGATTPPRDGEGGAGRRALRIDLTLWAASRQHLPPLEVSPGAFASGYTVPVLDGRARGRVCVGDRCLRLQGAPAYHDHNWGVWSGVTWDWGQARAGPYSVLYGGVRRAVVRDSGARASGSSSVGRAAGTGAGSSRRRPAADVAPGPSAGSAPAAGAPVGRRFLFLSDTLGFLGLFSLDSLGHRWVSSGEGRGSAPGAPRPRALGLRAARPPDTVRLEARIRHARTSRGDRTQALFYQMEGTARLEARLRGREIRAAGRGFFETWRRAPGRTDGKLAPPAPAQSRR